MCQRFGCLPSQLMAEDAQLIQLLAIETLAGEEGGHVEHS